MDYSWIKYILITMVSGLGVSVLINWNAERPADRQGWRRIRPGALYVFGAVLGAVLTLFMLLIWQSGESQRPDAESQTRILFWLIVVFSSCTLLMFAQCHAALHAKMRWRRETLVWQGRDGSEHCRSLCDAVALRQAWTGWIYIVFDDGLEARIDPYTSNASALIETVLKLNSEDIADLRP